MNRDYGKKLQPTQKMAEGGSVGLLERLRAGNVDEPGSEANMRWGSGKKAMDAAVAAEQASRAPLPSAEDNMRAVRDSIAADAPKMSESERNKFVDANASPAGADALEDNDPLSKVMKPAAAAAAPAPAPAKRRKAPPAATGGAAGGLASGLKYGRDSALEARASAPAPDKQTIEITGKRVPKDSSSMSLAERMSASRERARLGASETDSRPIGQRLREALGLKDGGMVKGYAKGGMVSDGRSYGKKC